MLHTHPPIWLRLRFSDITGNAAPDSKTSQDLLSLVSGSAFDKMIVPSLVLHPGAYLPEVCVPDPLSLHSVTWTEDVQSDVPRVSPCSRDVVLSCV